MYVAHQAPPYMEFSRQEYWSGLPFPSPGDLPDPGIECGPPAMQADALLSEPPGNPIIIQSKVSQKERVIYHILTHIYGVKINGTEEFIYRATLEEQT